MDEDKPWNELQEALSSLYTDGKYSDLTIVCGESTYRAHKALLCTRSQFFAKACDGGFAEARTGVIDLSDDDPQAVQMMMHYFYHLDYPHVALHEPFDGSTSFSKPSDESRTSAESLFLSRPDAAHSSPLSVAKRSGKATKRSHGPKKSTGGHEWLALDVDNEIRDPNLIIHAKVYALGEQYAVQGLKAIALEKFTSEARVHWATEDFLQAVEHVYSLTPDGDRGMREVVKNTFYEHRRDLMDRENVKRYLRDVPDLAYDVLMHLYKEGV